MLRKMIVVFFALGMSMAYGDVSGDWDFAVEITGMGGGNASVTLQEAADGTITGHYSGQLGNTDITGAAEGNDFQFAVTGDAGSVTYKGTLQDNDTLKGTLDLGGMAEGTFTATRK